jgi:outer membrane receptor protein involved in Fe transport
MTVTHKPWQAGLYVTNLLDKRAVLAPFIPNVYTNGGGLIQDETLNPPREVGIRVSYRF